MQPKVKFYVGLTLSILSVMGCIPIAALTVISAISGEIGACLLYVLLLGGLGCLYWLGHTLIQASGYLK